MSTQTDLPARIIAAIEEGEAGADGIHNDHCDLFGGDWSTGVCDCGEPARVLARCAADRDIVALHQPVDTDTMCPTCSPYSHGDAPCPTLSALAAGYGIESDDA